MKMTLKHRIDLYLENISIDTRWPDEQGMLVVYHSAALAGSSLSCRDNKILMNRNAIPKSWRLHPRRQNCIINYNLKKAYLRVNKYIADDYNVTPGRVRKLIEIILSGISDDIPRSRVKVKFDISLKELLEGVNNKRASAVEMSPLEIYDLSFDVMLESMEYFRTVKGGGRLSRLMMYWIQRENHLMPVAIDCDNRQWENILQLESGHQQRVELRKFMRKQLEMQLKQLMSTSKEVLTSRDRIMRLVKKDPKHTARTMAATLGISQKAVQKQIAILKAENRLKRIGPDKGGQWEVVNPPE